MSCANSAAGGQWIFFGAFVAPAPRPRFRACPAPGVAVAKRALQQHCVGPPPEAEGDRFQHAGARETKGLVQAKGRAVAAVDIADHLAVAGGRAGLDQRRQQLAADSGLAMVLVHIDRNA